MEYFGISNLQFQFMSKPLPSEKNFEKIKNEFLRIERELTELIDGAETYEEGILISKIKGKIEDKLVDKIRLLNDLTKLDAIQISEQISEGEKK